MEAVCRTSSTLPLLFGSASGLCTGCKQLPSRALPLKQPHNAAREHLSELRLKPAEVHAVVQTTRRPSRKCRAVVDADVSKQVDIAADISRYKELSGWGAFCSKVSGEWEGYEVTFEPSEGSWANVSALELPYEVVPEAFREWEIRLFDWQTQCSSSGSEDERSIFFKLARLLPTVGCEADAATVHSVVERTADGRGSSGPIAFLPDGSYSLSWPSDGGLSWEVEHGLVDGSGLRVRVNLFLKRATSDASPELTSIRVARERWDSAFEKGESLSSCGGKMRGFADDPRLAKEKLDGAWTAERHSFRTDFSDRGLEVTSETVQVERGSKEGETVLLPAGVWVKFGESADESFAVTAGWIQGEDKGASASRVYRKDGTLQEVVLVHETRS